MKWQTKKLGEVIELHYGKGLDRSHRKSDGDFPVFGANGELGRTDKFLTEGEAIIVGRKGSAGEVTRISGKFWPSDVTYYVFGNDKIDVDYLFNFFKSVDLTQFARGVKPGINRNDVYNIEIPLPPLTTQHQIVTILDEKFAKLREAKRLREEAIGDTEKILATTLREIFEEGKEKGWEEKLIKDICEHPQYGFTASSTQDPVGPKMLRITDIQDGAVDWDTVPYCQCDDVAKYQLRKDDLVFARTGATVGKSFLITEDPENAVYASYLIRLRTKANISSEFLYYFFQSPNYWSQITENAVGGAQPNVNGTKLANLNIFVPLLAEQQKIVTRLDALSEKLRSLRELQQSQLEDMKKLEKAYLREAFRGELEEIKKK